MDTSARAPAASSPPPAPLDYGRPGRLLTRRRAWWIVVAVVLTTILGITYEHRRAAAAFARRAEMVRWQHRWLTYQPPSRQIVYEDQPATRAALLQRSDFLPFQLAQDAAPRAALWHPPIFDDYYTHAQLPLFYRPNALVFLHERATPSGQRVIMSCELTMEIAHAYIEPYLQVEEYRPATFSKPLALMQTWRFSVPAFDSTFPAGKHLRLFAGQPDPNDATHFTIPFEIDDKPGILDIRDIGGQMSPVRPQLQGLRVEVRADRPQP